MRYDDKARDHRNGCFARRCRLCNVAHMSTVPKSMGSSTCQTCVDRAAKAQDASLKAQTTIKRYTRKKELTPAR